VHLPQSAKEKDEEDHPRYTTTLCCPGRGSCCSSGDFSGQEWACCGWSFGPGLVDSETLGLVLDCPLDFGYVAGRRGQQLIIAMEDALGAMFSVEDP
jgi:hypothetical protein